MENAIPDFLRRLEDALSQRAAWLEATRIPLLKDLVGTYRTLFESVVGTLVKKGLLRVDPYNYDGKTSAILVPPDTVPPDAEEDVEIGRRIAAYRRQMEFLATQIPFTLAALDLPLLKKVSALFSYLDWEGFSETSHSPTTRALARRVMNVGLSKDALSSRVLHESRLQIGKLSRDIRERIVEIESWHRESWKAALRAKVLPRVTAQEARTADERAARALVIKKAFEVASPDGTWHPHLVQEILGEDHPPGADERREKLLASLALPRAGVAKPDDGPRRRTELLDAIRGLCRAGEEIALCRQVLEENERAVETRKLGVFQKLRRWLRRRLGRREDRFYQIEYRSSAGAELQVETIDFLRLVSEMQELHGVLADVAQPGSPGHRRIEAMDEAKLCDFLDWQVRQLRQLHRRMEGLNVLFQVKAVEAQSAAVRSIKLELLAIENGLIRGDAARRDSMACREAPPPSPAAP